MEILSIDVPLWLLLLLSAALLLLYYKDRHYGMFKRMGVPGPEPAIFFGNFKEMLKLGFHKCDRCWIKTYGKVVGTFDMLGPNLIVTDEEFLKEVLVKQFNNFVNRRTLDGISGDLNLAVTALKGGHWKHVRNLMTPAFSTGKLRKMFRLVDTASDTLINTVDKRLKSDRDFEMRGLFGGFTMDVIASTAFGIEVDSQKNPQDPFVMHGREFLKTSFASPVLFVAAFFPFLIPVMRMLGFCVFSKKMQNFFRNIIDQLINERTEKRKDYLDFLQIMKDEHVEMNDSGVNVPDGEYCADRTGLTKTEIIAQAEIFLLAGFDTTSILLTWTSYNLATHSDIQDKLRRDIESKLAGKTLDYDTIQELEYLDMCINETLRIYPPAVRFDRRCTQDTIVNGLKIRKGMGIVIPVYAIHHDPDIWEDPDTFQPQRFLPENKRNHSQFAFMPFGYGPRNCIGMRLAYLEAKMAIAKLIRGFKITVSSKTQIPPVVKVLGGMLNPEELYLTLEKIK